MNLKSDDAVGLKGVLWASRGPWLTLRQVTVVRGDGSEKPCDGDVVVHRHNVAFIQVVGR